MPKYVIERELPGIGESTIDQLRAASASSNQVIADLGPEIRWLESFVTDNKMYCVYVAPSEEIILEHARCVGLPADRISKVVAIADPSWGE
jgi:hypothetical protein